MAATDLQVTAPVPHSPRAGDQPVDALFTDRWSPRSFDGSPVEPGVMLSLFEAARWAPSAFNHQPWRFVYATRDSAEWDSFVQLLLPFNQLWAQHAGALVFILSDQLIDGKDGRQVPSQTASFDAGAAWASLAFQAVRLGLHSRAMAGFDQDRARATLAIPDRFRMEAVVAIGRQGRHDALPEKIAAGDRPNDRRPLAESVHVGRFGNPLLAPLTEEA